MRVKYSNTDLVIYCVSHGRFTILGKSSVCLRACRLASPLFQCSHQPVTESELVVTHHNLNKRTEMEASEFKVVDVLDAAALTSALTDREKHLVGLAVTVTRGCAPCSGGRIEKVLNAGIEYETIRAAINAGVVVRTVIEGVARNNITTACARDECTAGTPS